MLISVSRKIREENKEHMPWFIIAEVEEKARNKVFWKVWMVIRENSIIGTLRQQVTNEIESS